MNLTASLTSDRAAAVPASSSRTIHMSEDEHRAFMASGATLAAWRDGTHAKHVREQAVAQRARDAENEALRVYNEGQPPRGSGLAGWKRWCDDLRDEIDKLESAAARLAKHVEAPTNTAAELLEVTKRGAQRVLVGLGILDADKLEAIEARDEADRDAAQLAARHAAELRASAEAVEALRTVEAKLDFARKALAALEARADEFVKPYLRDMAAQYSAIYVRKVGELQEIASRLFAAHDMLSELRDGWGNLNRIALPHPPACKTPDHKLDLKVEDADRQWWKESKAALLKNPDAKISLAFR
jgi:hypothetical protein